MCLHKGAEGLDCARKVATGWTVAEQRGPRVVEGRPRPGGGHPRPITVGQISGRRPWAVRRLAEGPNKNLRSL